MEYEYREGFGGKDYGVRLIGLENQRRIDLRDRSAK